MTRKRKSSLEFSDGPVTEPRNLMSPRHLHMHCLHPNVFENAFGFRPIAHLHVRKISEPFLEKLLHQDGPQYGSHGDICYKMDTQQSEGRTLTPQTRSKFKQRKKRRQQSNQCQIYFITLFCYFHCDMAHCGWKRARRSEVTTLIFSPRLSESHRSLRTESPNLVQRRGLCPPILS